MPTADGKPPPHGDLSCLNGVKSVRMPYIIAITGAATGAATNEQCAGPTGGGKAVTAMGRILKALVVLVILGFLGLVAYAYLADLSPRQGPVTVPVILDAN